ncbi:MAG: putative colanic acid biosynthesis acetyltransferase [Burkholderiaceae bacterium]
MNPPVQIRSHRYQRDSLSRKNVLARGLWSVVWLLLFRPTPRPMHRWRCFLLRLFGAKISRDVRVYQSARIWAPWNLEMHPGSCLGDDVDCYNVAHICLEEKAVVSQYSYLCSASRDYRIAELPLVSSPITVAKQAWVTADVFVGPGVRIGEGAVVTARSTVLSDIEPWVVASGNPATTVKRREFQAPQTSDQPATTGRSDG